MFDFKDVNDESGILKVAKEIAVEGFCQVQSVISKEEASDCCAEAMRLLQQEKLELEQGIRQSYADYRTYQYSGNHLYNLPRKTRKFDFLLGHPFVVATLDKLFNAQSILSQTELRRPVKGADKNNRGYQFHTDGRMPVKESLWAVLFWMFEDFTKTNGATIVIPRTQFASEPVDTEKAEKVTILGKAGDLFFMNANLLHKTGENVDGTSRWVLIPTYNPWFIKPSVDHTKLFTRSEFEQMSPQLKQIYGFTSVPPSDERKRVYTCRPWEEMVDEIAFADEPAVQEAN